MDKTIQRLINAIKNGKFAFEKHYERRTWHGVVIQTTDMFCSYGIIGYEVSMYNEDKYGRLDHIASITHDWDLNKTKVEYYNNEKL